MAIKYKTNVVELEHVTGSIDVYSEEDTDMISHFEMTVREDTGLLSKTFYVFDEQCPYKHLEILNKKVALIKVMNEFTREMEGYSYYGSNPGVSVDDYEDIADAIMKSGI